ASGGARGPPLAARTRAARGVRVPAFDGGRRRAPIRPERILGDHARERRGVPAPAGRAARPFSRPARVARPALRSPGRAHSLRLPCARRRRRSAAAGALARRLRDQEQLPGAGDAHRDGAARGPDRLHAAARAPSRTRRPGGGNRILRRHAAGGARARLLSRGERRRAAAVSQAETSARRSVLTSASTMAPKNAGKKPLTWKPGTIPVASQMRNAITTKWNSPKVRIVRGSARKSSTGP